MPMGHGSGSVAGKYTFGARTAGSNVILGVFDAVAAVLAVGIVAAVPLPMLGVVLGLIALELGRAGLDTDHLLLTLGIGLLGLMTNIGIAFLVGALGYLLLEEAALDYDGRRSIGGIEARTLVSGEPTFKQRVKVFLDG